MEWQRTRVSGGAPSYAGKPEKGINLLKILLINQGISWGSVVCAQQLPKELVYIIDKYIK